MIHITNKISDISKTCMLETRSQNDLYCHWRYKYDPPEFQTVLASSEVTNTFHIGYFRDDPKEMPAFVASSGGKKCEETFSNGLSSYVKLTQMGDNLFGTVYNHIQKLIQTAEPFKQTALQKMKGALHVHATIKTQVIYIYIYIYIDIVLKIYWAFIIYDLDYLPTVALSLISISFNRKSIIRSKSKPLE